MIESARNAVVRRLKSGGRVAWDGTMPYKVTRFVRFRTPDIDEAVDHFVRSQKMVVLERTDDQAELLSEEATLIIERGEQFGPILETLVPSTESARAELEPRGWKVVVWKGNEKIMSNPEGTLFSFNEAPDEFKEGQN